MEEWFFWCSRDYHAWHCMWANLGLCVLIDSFQLLLWKVICQSSTRCLVCNMASSKWHWLWAHWNRFWRISGLRLAMPQQWQLLNDQLVTWKGAMYFCNPLTFSLTYSLSYLFSSLRISPFLFQARCFRRWLNLPLVFVLILCCRMFCYACMFDLIVLDLIFITVV